MPPIKCFSWSTLWVSRQRVSRQRASRRSRVITRSKFARVLFAFGIILSSVLLAKLSAGLPAKESRTPPTTAMRQEVWQAVLAELQREGLQEEHLPRIEDLDLPGALPLLAGRRLRVSSACWDEGPRRTQFRLECVAPGQCLPFLVYVPENPDHVDADTAGRARSCRLASASSARPK